ncbi:hypothetical protein [Paucibacter soli]|uniref:hypothetical protein n=1 Tax=Paucibacter soli TaxID=3133433 RepID=UPI00309C7C39
MTNFSMLKTSLALATTLLLAPMAQANTISKLAYGSAKDKISADYKIDKAACASQAGNAKDVCVEQAKAKEKIAKHELQYNYSGKQDDWTKLEVARAEAGYAVAKERCDDQAGNARDVCRKEAKAVETKALADAKLSKRIVAAKVDAMDEKRDADYKVAAEKCEAMAGDAKAGCISAAKAKFGKS